MPRARKKIIPIINDLLLIPLASIIYNIYEILKGFVFFEFLLEKKFGTIITFNSRNRRIFTSYKAEKKNSIFRVIDIDNMKK